MRRRGPTVSLDTKNQLPTQDASFTFTTKYIDTLNDLQRLEDENKRLMTRVRSLEAQIVPASKNSQETYVKILAPSCLEYHNEERKLNKALQEENEMLRRQFHNSVNAAAEANEKLIEAINKNKLLELSMAGRVDGATNQHNEEVKKGQSIQTIQPMQTGQSIQPIQPMQPTQPTQTTQPTQGIMQGDLLDFEVRWANEKKLLSAERDEYALQCSSLKAAAAAVKARLEACEKERLMLRQQLAFISEGNGGSQINSNGNNNNNKRDRIDNVGEDNKELSTDEIPQLLERSSSKSTLSDLHSELHQSRSVEHVQFLNTRPPTATRAPLRSTPSPLLSRSPQSRGLLSRGTTDTNDSRTPQMTARPSDSLPKLENDMLVLSAKNKELQKAADQNRILAEEMEAQNEILAMEVKRLSDKLRLLTAIEGRFFTRPESPPILPTVKNGPSRSPSTTALSLSGPPLSSSGKVTKRTVPGNKTESPTMSKSGRILKDRPSSAIPQSPPLTPWDANHAGPLVSGQKILSPKKVTRNG